MFSIIGGADCTAGCNGPPKSCEEFESFISPDFSDSWLLNPMGGCAARCHEAYVFDNFEKFFADGWSYQT